MKAYTRRQLLWGLLGAGAGTFLATHFRQLSQVYAEPHATRPIIVGIKGMELDSLSKNLITMLKPAGYILHAHNITNRQQLADLTTAIYKISGSDVIMLIDQEGGPVSRLHAPNWQNYSAPSTLGKIAEKSLADGARATYLNFRLMAYDMAECGINTNAAPVLDMFYPGYESDFYNYRSFGTDPALIVSLGKIACQATLEGGVLPIVKHMPGQGRAKADVEKGDSHIAESLDQIKKDAAIFKPFADMPLGMTSLVTFDQIDSAPVSFSKKAMQWVRGEIGFSGLMMSDDLLMGNLRTQDFQMKNAAVLHAGLDLCMSGIDLDALFELAPQLDMWPAPNAATQQRIKDALAFAKQSFKPCDPDAYRDELAALLARYT